MKVHFCIHCLTLIEAGGSVIYPQPMIPINSVTGIPDLPRGECEMCQGIRMVEIVSQYVPTIQITGTEE